MIAAGYTPVTQAGVCHDSTAEDFTAQISEFKKAGCEIVSGIETPPALHQLLDPVPPAGLQAQGLLLRQGPALPSDPSIAIGDIGIGLSDEVVWHPSFPYKSYLTGQTCQELRGHLHRGVRQAVDRAARPVGKYEWAVDVSSASPTSTTRRMYVHMVTTTKLDGINGPIDFTT